MKNRRSSSFPMRGSVFDCRNPRRPGSRPLHSTECNTGDTALPECVPGSQRAGGGTNRAQFNASYSDPASLDAYSLRVDHKLNDKLTLFGRYSYSPSSCFNERKWRGRITVLRPGSRRNREQWGSLGLFASTVNDLRFNYSRNSTVVPYT